MPGLSVLGTGATNTASPPRFSKLIDSLNKDKLSIVAKQREKGLKRENVRQRHREAERK